MRYIERRISVDVDVKEFSRGGLEKKIPKRGKVEIGVCKEEESNFEGRVFRREMKEFGGV